MTTTKHASFIIRGDTLQVWAITSVDDSQLKWLEMLAGLIEGGEVTPEPVVSNEDVHFGLFTYQAFRDFMRQAGYGKAIDQADLTYRFKN